MSKAFYRKYRSKSLAEVVGQDHITDILTRSLKEGAIAHAYLFTGPRGVGKTSIARILAHEINDLPYDDDSSHLDIIEIDAASNNGVEDIRDLRERVQLAPVSAKKKVYIIDEVHMLSKAAFNALLKTLEEPPEHVVFILATTDADKLPDTIVSRTQRFTFRTISTADIARHLAWIAKQEGFSVDKDALHLIAVHGGGSFRDSIGLLDQLHSAADKKAGVTKELVASFLGLPPAELISGLLAAYDASDLSAITTLLGDAEQAGVQPHSIASELMHSIRSEVVERPQLLPLLDALLDVAHSSRPDIKLLTSLAGTLTIPAAVAAPKAKTVALESHAPAISVPVPDKNSAPPKAKAVPKAAPDIPEAAPASPSTTLASQEFDWGKVLEHIQKNYIAIYAVLAKTSAHLDSTTLTLYTGNAFYKKKLDDIRYRTNIITTLEALGMGNLTIETVAASPPPKDELAASVAAIMGGGEEYNIDETESN